MPGGRGSTRLMRHAIGVTVIDAVSPEVVHQLAPGGVLRAAINLGNPVLAHSSLEGGEPTGVSVDLARELGSRLTVPVALVTFDAAASVVAALQTQSWDVAFLAVDPLRAAWILFTAPYAIIEGTYLVRDDSPLQVVEQFDRPGVRIAVGEGAAYDLYLTRTLKNAELVRSETSAGAVELFLAAGLDAAAGVKRALLDYACAHAGLRVIGGRFVAIEQAMGTPQGRPAARAYLQAFVEDVKRSGFVAAALERSDQHEARVAPPQATWPYG